MQILERRIRSRDEALIGEAVLLNHLQSHVSFVFFVPKIIHPHIALNNLPVSADFLYLNSCRIELDTVLAAHIADGALSPPGDT